MELDWLTQFESLRLGAIRLPLAALFSAILAFRPRRRGTPERQFSVVQTQIILAIVGAVIDVTCDLTYILVLPGRAADDVSRFLLFERHLGTASLTGANGLYSLAVLVATLGLPASATLTRGLGVLTFVAGLVLAGAGLTGDPRHVMVGTALTIPFFLAWSLAASSSPHPR